MKPRKQAKVKLDAIRNKIGYPDVYRDYSSVVIKPNDLLGNIAARDEVRIETPHC